MNLKKIINDFKQDKDNFKSNIESELIKLGLNFAIDDNYNIVIMRTTMVNVMGDRLRFFYEDNSINKQLKAFCDDFERFGNDEIACTWQTSLALVMELIPFSKDNFEYCSYVPFSPDFNFTDITCQNNIFKISSKDKAPLLLDFETLIVSTSSMLSYFLQCGIDMYMSDRCIANQIRFKEEERLLEIAKLSDKKKKAKYDKKMSVLPPMTLNTLVPEHFKLNDDMELKLLLWGKKYSIDIYDIDLSKIKSKDLEQVLHTYIRNFQNAVNWIDKNKKLFIQEILDYGTFDELVMDEEEFLITEKDFINSLILIVFL